MPIDFSKFTQTVAAVVPVHNNRFQYNRKKFTVSPVEDGWYEVVMTGNDAQIMHPAYVSSHNLSVKPTRGYTYNNMFIFHNFDVAKRNFKKEVQAELLFNNFPTFSSVEVIPWEDGNFYAYQPNYSDLKIYEIKALYDSEQSVDLDSVKGITPELRTLYLFHDIQRQTIKLELEKLKKEEDKRKWLESLPGRLHTVFKAAGASVINYELNGHRAVIDWELDSTKRRYNSVIDTRDFRVIEAGYCMSGHDREHTAGSMVQLAADYEERRLTHITRFTGSDDERDHWDD